MEELDEAGRILEELARQRSPAARRQVIARALHEAYRLGRAEALAGLVTASELARQMGVSSSVVSRLAARLGLGWHPAGEQSPLLLTAEEAERIRTAPRRPGGRPRRLSRALEEAASGFEALAAEDVTDGDPGAAETGLRIAQHLRRLGYVHRAAAAYQQRPELDPEQEE
jgi:DNA-binding LacI/PurR family transcriptional regulator